MIIRLLMLFLAARAFSAQPTTDEYRVKGAFLLNFAKFVTWPDDVFKGPTEPIVICIPGKSPFGAEFEQAAQRTVVDTRTVAVRESSNPSQLAHGCHILFVGGSECRHLRSLLQPLETVSVLTVGECEGFNDGGGIIAFKLEGDKVRIEISTAAAAKAKLHISAKLLSLAQGGRK